MQLMIETTEECISRLKRLNTYVKPHTQQNFQCFQGITYSLMGSKLIIMSFNILSYYITLAIYRNIILL